MYVVCLYYCKSTGYKLRKLSSHGPRSTQLLIGRSEQVLPLIFLTLIRNLAVVFAPMQAWLVIVNNMYLPNIHVYTRTHKYIDTYVYLYIHYFIIAYYFVYKT